MVTYAGIWWPQEPETWFWAFILGVWLRPGSLLEPLFGRNLAVNGVCATLLEPGCVFWYFLGIHCLLRFCKIVKKTLVFKYFLVCAASSLASYPSPIQLRCMSFLKPIWGVQMLPLRHSTSLLGSVCFQLCVYDVQLSAFCLSMALFGLP